MRHRLFERDGDRCFYCGAVNEFAFYHADHVTPRCRGGSDSIENRVLACLGCDQAKAAKPGWLFVIERAVGPVAISLPLELLMLTYDVRRPLVAVEAAEAHERSG